MVLSSASERLTSVCEELNSGLCTGEALRLLEQCKELAPTLPELYTVQSRILKHAGDPQGAAEAACKAESMDLADRCAH